MICLTLSYFYSLLRMLTISVNICVFIGGTFALYSLLCRHAKVNTIPNQHRTDEKLTTYVCHTFDENSAAFKVKKWLEAHTYKKNILLILVLIGTCMVIGDGILTPAISGDFPLWLFLNSDATYHVILRVLESVNTWIIFYNQIMYLKDMQSFKQV